MAGGHASFMARQYAWQNLAPLSYGRSRRDSPERPDAKERNEYNSDDDEVDDFGRRKKKKARREQPAGTGTPRKAAAAGGSTGRGRGPGGGTAGAGDGSTDRGADEAAYEDDAGVSHGDGGGEGSGGGSSASASRLFGGSSAFASGASGGGGVGGESQRPASQEALSSGSARTGLPAFGALGLAGPSRSQLRLQVPRLAFGQASRGAHVEPTGASPSSGILTMRTPSSSSLATGMPAMWAAPGATGGAFGATALAFSAFGVSFGAAGAQATGAAFGARPASVTPSADLPGKSESYARTMAMLMGKPAQPEPERPAWHGAGTLAGGSGQSTIPREVSRHAKAPNGSAIIFTNDAPLHPDLASEQGLREKKKLNNQIMDEHKFPCKFFNETGQCKEGALCRFSHQTFSQPRAMSNLRAKRYCNYFGQGKCMRGTNCPYIHGAEDQSHPDSAVQSMIKSADFVDFDTGVNKSEVHKLAPTLPMNKLVTKNGTVRLDMKSWKPDYF